MEPLANLGFAGGCNLGIGDPAAGAYDFVALLNNDAIPEPGWLAPLVDDPRRRSRARRRLVEGVVLLAVLGDADRDGRVARQGRPAERPDGRRSAVMGRRPVRRRVLGGRSRRRPTSRERGGPCARAEVRVESSPEEAPPARVAVRLSAASDRTVTLSTGGEVRGVTVTAEPAWFELALPGRAARRRQQRRLQPLRRRVRRRPRLPRARRGPVRRRHRRVRVVRRQRPVAPRLPRGCGALRRAVLPLLRGHRPVVARTHAGLALPLRARFGRAPRHSASTAEGSDLFRYFVERNRLLMLTKVRTGADRSARRADRSALGGPGRRCGVPAAIGPPAAAAPERRSAEGAVDAELRQAPAGDARRSTTARTGQDRRRRRDHGLDGDEVRVGRLRPLLVDDGRRRAVRRRHRRRARRRARRHAGRP